MPQTQAAKDAKARWRQKNPEYHKNYNKEDRDMKREIDPDFRKKELAFKRYGLTPEAVEQMYQDQKGICPSCMRFFGYNWGDLDIDHDHETDEVRCLLCRSCNTTEGKVVSLWPFLLEDLWTHIRRNLEILRGV